MSETTLDRFRQSAIDLANRMISVVNGALCCRINSEAEYNDAGALLSAIRDGRKKWLDWLKKDPGKNPSECQGLEGAYYFAYQNYERQRKIVNDGLAWFEPRERAVANAIREYDLKKQAEIERKQAKIREQMRKADAEKLEVLIDREKELWEKSEQISRGPSGTVKVTTFIPIVHDKAAFLKWVVRTESWQLVEVAEGQLKKHVNALAGKNLPDGVSVRREDVIRRKAS
jgi:hypothetical protein